MYKKITEPILANNIGSVRLSTWIIQVLGLAAAYFFTGKLGTFLAIPPGYATAIWPPSGIALAGILVFGYRVWPGVMLGSFLVNFSTSFTSPPPGSNRFNRHYIGN